MKTLQNKSTIWYLKDNYELLQARIAITALELKSSILSKENLIKTMMPPQPPKTFWLEDEEHEADKILYVTRKWIKEEDMIWMENL